MVHFKMHSYKKMAANTNPLNIHVVKHDIPNYMY